MKAIETVFSALYFFLLALYWRVRSICGSREARFQSRLIRWIRSRTASAEAMAFAQITSAAESGDSVAELFLGRFYSYDEERRNPELSVAWLRRASDHGEGDADYVLGLLYASGSGVPADDREAFRCYERAAKRESVEGMNCAGRCLIYGRGTGKDVKAGLRWLRLAAQKGDASSMWLLGQCYQENVGVEPDLEALKWHRLAVFRS